VKGVEIRELTVYEDGRGWLAEIIRSDETDLRPEMAYISMTRPGQARGPHEHREQTDFFCFIGRFRLYLWDNRNGSETFGEHKVIDSNGKPTVAVIPPGVVHAYRNLDDSPGMVINFPDRLYRGKGRAEEVDEIRYEDAKDSPFRIDD
jgi:dTDP-4-dehydrorhamnose 3,5-epimerase